MTGEVEGARDHLLNCGHVLHVPQVLPDFATAYGDRKTTQCLTGTPRAVQDSPGPGSPAVFFGTSSKPRKTVQVSISPQFGVNSIYFKAKRGPEKLAGEVRRLSKRFRA